MEEYEMLIYLFDTLDHVCLGYDMSEELAAQVDKYCDDPAIWELAIKNEEIDNLLLAAANRAAKYVHEYYIAADDKLKEITETTEADIENMWDRFNVDEEERAEFYNESAEDQISDLAGYLYDNQAFTINFEL